MSQSMSSPSSNAASINITLPDGNVRHFDQPVTGAELALSIGKGLAKAALFMRVDGRDRDLSHRIDRDARIEIITRDKPDALEIIRHDTAHVLAEAVQMLYPGTQVTIGPSIENGFYYDFARAEPFTPDDLPKIEAKMREIIDSDQPFVREVWPRDKAIAHFEAAGEKYKAELIRDLPETEEISVYRQGNWLDLCRGPHMPTTGKIGKAFKLTKIAGAYWRGDHRNPVLQRIYGTAWRDEKELNAYLTMMEEAEKRDHRKLGRELDLFHMQEEAVGSVFWHARGWTLWRLVENLIRARIQSDGYIEVRTPQLYDRNLFEKSGHWSVYGDKMFKVPLEDNKILGVKPMNCPAHVQIFNQGIKSYKDLPIRMAEFGACHRNEPSGSLHGIMRVRAFTQDDAHIFCRDDQIEDEALKFFKLQLSVYKDLGFEKISVKLALRPGPEERLGDDATWDRAENGLRQALDKADLKFEELPGEGAFYGPKVEFHLTDAIGRAWQCGTLQLDFIQPERLGAVYIGQDGYKHAPVMMHRAVLGSLERFIGMLIEHYAGKFPLWLAPVQAVVATITNDADDYAGEVARRLWQEGMRIETDVRPEKINYKIREHSLQKIPLLFVVGKKEAEGRSVAVRRFGVEQQEVIPLAEIWARFGTEALGPLTQSVR